MRNSIIVAASLLALSPAYAAQEAAQPAPAEGANPKAAVAAKVEGDFSKYDLGKKGHLTREEFGKWMSDLRTAASQPAPDANWIGSAFTQTDTDADKKISPAELTAFLTSAG
jgi:Ca2+-binding EF-hand superfamily protein